MLKIIIAIVKKNGRLFQGYCQGVADAITNNDPEAKSQNLRSIATMIITRLVLWGMIGFVLSRFDGWDLKGYIYLVCIVYGVAIGLAVFSDEEPPTPAKPAEPPLPTVDESTTLRHARDELDTILDIAMVALPVVAKHHAIEVSTTKEELAYPKKSECIHLDGGVPVITVMARLCGEVSSAEVCEDFNLCLGQLFDGNKLPNAPAAVYWDANQNAIQSIQAVNHYLVGRYVILDLVHVKDEASAAYVKSHTPSNTDGAEPPAPPASPYFG